MRGLRVVLLIVVVPSVISVVVFVTMHDHLSGEARTWLWLGPVFLWAEAALHAFADWVKRDTEK